MSVISIDPFSLDDIIIKDNKDKRKNHRKDHQNKNKPAIQLKY